MSAVKGSVCHGGHEVDLVVIGSGIADLLEKDGLEDLAYMGRRYPTEYELIVDETIGPDNINVTTWRKYEEEKRIRSAAP